MTALRGNPRANLLACPCCGSPAIFVPQSGSPNFGHVECSKAECQLRTRESCIADHLWNQRAHANEGRKEIRNTREDYIQCMGGPAAVPWVLRFEHL